MVAAGGCGPFPGRACEGERTLPRCGVAGSRARVRLSARRRRSGRNRLERCRSHGGGSPASRSCGHEQDLRLEEGLYAIGAGSYRGAVGGGTQIRQYPLRQSFTIICRPACGLLLPSVLQARRGGRTTYRWLQFVEHRPCHNAAQLKRFYERCGVLLCLVYALNGSDLHYENLIASGEFPILLDLENLLRPRLELSEESIGDELASAGLRGQITESVLGTCMLPHLKVCHDGRAMDLGGLTGVRDSDEASVMVGWVDPNTDAMKMARVRAPLPGCARNAPMLNGLPAQADEHLDQLVAGFARAYRMLLAGRDELLEPGGVLTAFASQRVRFVFRDTGLYASILERALHPEYLEDGAERGFQLDVLCRSLLTLDARPAIWPIIEAETKALEVTDIPLFAVQADSADLVLPSGKVIQRCFSGAPYERVVRRIRSLNEKDLSLQLELIRNAFAANRWRDLRALPCGPAVDPSSVPARTRLRERALAQALAVGETLRERATYSRGEAGWITAAYLPDARRYRIAPAAANLFDGYLGIALFLGALEHVSAGAGFADLALAPLAPLRRRIQHVRQGARLRRCPDIGAATGLGSAAYALAHLAHFLGRPELLDDARRIATVITPKTALGASCDVLSGAAGAILVLLALFDKTDEEHFAARAADIGSQLLQRRVADARTGLRVWPRRDRVAETGFAYGQAGVAYALHRLSFATSEPAFGAAADEAIAFERQLLGRSLEGTCDENLHAAWSHGAAGIGLARLARPNAADSPVALAEIDAAIHVTRKHLHDGVDSLCCGTAGRIELLLAAARKLRRQELSREAQHAAAHVIACTKTRGTVETGWRGDAAQLGLFHGSAGIAYQLLRVAYAGALPSLLVWE